MHPSSHERYLSALHQVQTAIALELSSGTLSHDPKHQFVGVASWLTVAEIERLWQEVAS